MRQVSSRRIPVGRSVGVALLLWTALALVAGPLSAQTVTLVRDTDYPNTGTIGPAGLLGTECDLFYSTSYAGTLYRSDGSYAGTMQIAPTTGVDSFSEYKALVGSKIVYSFYNSSKIWITDGTPDGTRDLKTFRPGGGSGKVGFMQGALGKVFFSADDGIHGQELWVTDGTESGTHLVGDINPSGDSMPRNAVEYNGRLYFTASNFGDPDFLWLWSTDGSTLTQVTSVRAGKPNIAQPLMTVYAGYLYFSGTDSSGVELWRTDGTNTARVADINSGAASGYPFGGIVFNGILYFTAYEATTGYELHRTDGTAAGTSLLKDISPGTSSSYPSNYAVLNGALLFSADDGDHHGALWRTDGSQSGTTLVRNLAPGSSGGGFYSPVVNGGHAYFYGGDPATGSEPWVTDGTDAGTHLIADVNYGTASSYPSGFTPVGSKVLFFATTPFFGQEIYRIDTCASPAAPTGLMASGGETSAHLAWSVVAGASKYYVYRANTSLPGGVFARIGETTSPWFDDSATAGNTYTYKVSAADSAGCESLLSTPADAHIGCFFNDKGVYAFGPAQICPTDTSGETILLNDNGGLAASYSWGYRTTPGGVITTIPYQTMSKYTARGSDFPGDGTYFLVCTITLPCGSTTLTDEAQLVISSTFEVSIYAPVDACPGSTQWADAGWMQDATYSWSITGGTLAGPADQPYVSFTMGSDPTGVTLHVTVIKSGSCTGYGTRTVTATPPPVVTAPSSICPMSNGMASVPGTYSAYSWSIQHGTFLGYPYGNSVGFTSDATGPVQLEARVTTSGGCELTSTATIPVSDLVPPVITAPTDVCPYGWATASVPAGYNSYSWSAENGYIGMGQSTNSITFSPSNMSWPMRLTVTVQNADMCYVSSSTTVDQKTIPPPTITAPLELCPGGRGSASVSASYQTYWWTVQNGYIYGGQGTDAIQFSPSGSAWPVQVSVVVQSPDGCVATSATADVGMKAIPAPSVSAPVEICPGGTGTASVPANYSSYWWTAQNGYISAGQGTNAIQFSPSGSAWPVQVSVTVQSVDGCATNSSTANVAMKTLPAPAVTAPLEICPSGTGTASVPANYSSYWWTVQNGYINGGQGTNAIQFSPSNSAWPVQVSVTVQSADGCAVSSATANVAMKTIPAPSITAPSEICLMATGTASVPSGYSSYYWSAANGAITAGQGTNIVQFSPGQPGTPVTLMVTMKTPDSCDVMTSATVNLKTIPPPGITAPSEVCANVAATASVPAVYRDYLWSVTNALIVSGKTTDTVTFRPDGNGPVQVVIGVRMPDLCENQTVVTIPVKTVTPAVITVPDEVCPTAQSTASVQGTFSTYAWSITNGTIDSGADIATVTFTAGASGPVVLMVTVDQGLCSTSTATATIQSCYADAVVSLAARSTDGTNTIMWLNPATGGYRNTIVRVRSDGTYPTGPNDGEAVALDSGQRDGISRISHPTLTNGTVYRYAAFVESASHFFSTSRVIGGRPLATAGPVKWAYNTGASAMTAPGVNSSDGRAYVVSNDRIYHGLRTGAAGGDWPTGWKPPLMNAPSQSRTLPGKLTINGMPRLISLVGSQDGRVYCVDASTGAVIWVSPILGPAVQGSPGAISSVYGAPFNMVFAASRDADAGSRVFGLNANDGTVAWTFDNSVAVGGDGKAIGVINDSINFDYAEYAPGKRRAYFASRRKSDGSQNTVWCLSFDATSVQKLWAVDAGDIDGFPFPNGATMYAGTVAGEVLAIDAANGSLLWSSLPQSRFSTGDGQVKTTIWPDTSAGRLYFSTDNYVWALGFDGSLKWQKALPSPSTPNRFNNRLYIGAGDGHVYELGNLTVTDPVQLVVHSLVLGDPAQPATVGDTTIDRTNSYLYVGTEGGSVYAVSLPLP